MIALGLLRAVPVWAWALAGALAWGAWQKHRATEAGAELAAVLQQTAQLRESAMHQALIETTRRLSAQQEAADAAERQARRARADSAAAAGAADRLRDHAARLAASAAACDPAAAGVGPAASAPGSVLADMLGRLEAHGRELAAEADRRGIAGSECAQRYDALTLPSALAR